MPWALVELLRGGANAVAARAMVAGMAMALLAPRDLSTDCTFTPDPCTEPLSTILRSLSLHRGEVRNIKGVALAFTPLLSAVQGVLKIVYDMVVWGCPPAAIAAWRPLARSLALTSVAPLRCSRACIPVAGHMDSLGSAPRPAAVTSFVDYVGNLNYIMTVELTPTDLTATTSDAEFMDIPSDAGGPVTPILATTVPMTDDYDAVILFRLGVNMCIKAGVLTQGGQHRPRDDALTTSVLMTVLNGVIRREEVSGGAVGYLQDKRRRGSTTCGTASAFQGLPRGRPS
jgi:hypothetical protein